MQGAKLEVDDKHSRGRLGANDVASELERIDGGIAAHESDHGTFDRARKPEALDEFEIGPGGEKPVQQVSSRWVMRSHSAPSCKRSTAACASAGACCSNRRKRTAVSGKLPRGEKPLA